MEPIFSIVRPSPAREARKTVQAGPNDGGSADARSLVAVDPVASSDPSHATHRRPQPAFLAHLVAVKQRAPQTRAGRRAEPAEAAAIYGAALVPPSATLGSTLRRFA